MTVQLPGIVGEYSQQTGPLSKDYVNSNLTTASKDYLLNQIGDPTSQFSANLTYNLAQLNASGVQAPTAPKTLAEWKSGEGSALYDQVREDYLGVGASQRYPNMSLADRYANIDRVLNTAYQSYFAPLNAKYVTDVQVAAERLPTGATGQYEKLIGEAKDVANAGAASLASAQQMYGQVAGEYAAREQNLTQYLEGLGQSQRDDLARKEAAAQSSLQQDMINRGMISTSVMDSLRGGLTSQYGQQRTALEDTLTREKMDYLSALSGATLSARDREAQGARETAMQTWQMQQSPLSARQAYADALARQREFDLNMRQSTDQAKMEAALGYAGLRSQEAQAMQQAQLQRDAMRSQEHMNYANLVNQLHLAQMQVTPTQYSPYSYPIYNYGSPTMKG